MIKILFIDTSALLSFFISDKGTPTMRQLFSSDTTAKYIINNQVIAEFEERIQEMVSNQEIRPSTANSVLSLFNTHYKKKTLKVVGKDASIQKTIDGMYNFLGRMSRPILVTCNPDQIAEVQAQGYQTINPHTRTPEEIDTILAQEETAA